MIPIKKFIFFGWDQHPELERIDIIGAPPFMHGLKAVFATDLHIRDITPDTYIADISRMLGAQGADMLLLGGDYGESQAATKRLFAALSREKFPLGIIGVPGNNDIEFFGDISALRRVFPGKLLANITYTLALPGGSIKLGGLDELKYGAYPEHNIFSAGENDYRLLLSHYPKLPAWASGPRPDMMLAGHTHGGQFRIFGLDPYSIGFESRNADAVRDISEHHGVTLLVSNGVGVSRLPLRIGCPPQVHLIEWHKK